VAVDVIARVAAAVSVPVTADIEWGYTDEPGGVAATMTAVVEAGAVGVNIEDSRNGQLVPALDHVRVLEQAIAATPFPVFVNARIDAFLLGVGMNEAIRRAELYVEAGVHGIFIPGAADPADIAAVVAAVKAPVNVMVDPGSAAMTDLVKAGARRISLGAQLAQSAYGELRTWAQRILTDGAWTELPTGAAGSDLQ
jgi:2-methylisocitrate lyase-like PEP mutase family enzyme